MSERQQERLAFLASLAQLPDDRLINSIQLSWWLDRSLRTVGTMLAEGKLPTVRLGPRHVRFKVGSIRRYLSASEQGEAAA